MAQQTTASSDSAWKPVEQAMGRSGQVQPDGAMKFGLPRSDLKVVLGGTEVLDGQPGLLRCEFRRRAVFVGCADVQHVMAPLPQVAGIHVGRKHGADQVAEMLHPVDVREGTRNQISLHGYSIMGSEAAPSFLQAIESSFAGPPRSG